MSLRNYSTSTSLLLVILSATLIGWFSTLSITAYPHTAKVIAFIISLAVGGWLYVPSMDKVSQTKLFSITFLFWFFYLLGMSLSYGIEAVFLEVFAVPFIQTLGFIGAGMITGIYMIGVEEAKQVT